MEYIENNGLKLPNWNTFKLDGFIDNIKDLIESGIILADEIANLENPSFIDVVERFNKLRADILLKITVLNHLKSVLSKQYPGIEQVDEESSKLLSNFDSKLNFHYGLYSAYKKVKAAKEFSTLNEEEKHIVNEAIKNFELNGVNLSEEKQEELKKLKEREAELGSKFSSNSVKATDAWALHITDSSQISDLPIEIISIYEEEAKQKGLDRYVIPLKFGSYIAALELSNNREIREKLWRAYNARCSEIGYGENALEFNNSEIITELIKNRARQAEILGFKNYSELSISTKVAGSVGISGVDDFLNTIATSSIKKSLDEKAELITFHKDEFGIEELRPWDIARISFLHKEKFYSLNDEEVRNYFPAKKVITGLTSLIEKLFDCTILENDNVSVWHPSVKFYEVRDSNGKVFAGFYVDILERAGKKGGAWMESLTYKEKDNSSLPVALLVSNFRDSKTEESYLSHSEVTTLFHEMGHVFHHLLSKTNYISSGIMNVEWDAIELPSQLLEEWAWKKDILKSISCHKETNEALPDEIFNKIVASRNYLSGISAGAQTGLGLFDWNIHKEKEITIDKVLNIYSECFKKSSALEVHKDARRPHTFSHIFGGGYSAGYFSYNWANAMVADIANIFNESNDEKATANKYKTEILEYGSSRPFMESFRAFAGRDLETKHLIPFLGLE